MAIGRQRATAMARTACAVVLAASCAAVMSEPARADTPAGFAIERINSGMRVHLSADRLFAGRSADLAPSARDVLLRTAAAVRRGGPGEVMVIGHTDVAGEEAFNLNLSQRRAEAVAAWLRTQPDVPGRVFKAIGRGEADQILPQRQDDPEVQARNRRVVVDIPG